MCLIIDRMPNVKVPFNMLEIACDVNKHGFGMSFIEPNYRKSGKPRLIDIKVLEEGKDTNPDEVMKTLEKHISKRVFLHLRHSTVGAITVENAHPFFPVTVENYGVDIGFCHNGTLWDWKPTDTTVSDSRMFAMEFIKPLAERISRYCGPDKVLLDPLFQGLMKRFAGLNSMFLCFDNFGNVLRVNEQLGEQHEGWWSSNKYSFNAYHPRTTKTRPAIPDYTQFNGDEGDIGAYGSYGSGYYEDATRSSATNTFRGNARHGLPWKHEPRKRGTIGGFVPNTPQKTFWEQELEAHDRIAEAVRSSANGPKKHTELRLQWEMDKVSRILLFTIETPESIMTQGIVNTKTLDVNRQSFCEQSGIKNIYDVGNLTKVQLAEMCEQHPQAMTELIIDLFTMVPKGKPSLLLDIAEGEEIVGG